MIPELQTKSATAERVVINEEDGTVEAFVSVTGVVDNVNDIIEPGAYAKSLAKRRPKGVWAHDWQTPVSRAVVVKELLPGDEGLPQVFSDGSPWPAEAGALYVKMQFNLETQRGRDAFSDVKFYRDDQEWSIGYSVPADRSTVEEGTGIRRIKELDLFEYSPVLFGAASQARTKKSLLDAVSQTAVIDNEFLSEVKTLLEEELKDFPHIESKDSTAAIAEQPVSGPVPEEDDDTEEAIVQELEEATDNVSSLQEDATEGTLTPDVITHLKELMGTLQEVLGKIGPVASLAEDKPTENIPAPAAKEDAPEVEEKTEVKESTMREVMDSMIYHTDYDSTRLNILDDGVRQLSKTIESNDSNATAAIASTLMDQVEFAMGETTDNGFKQGLQKLAKAIYKALETINEDAPEKDNEEEEQGSTEDTESREEVNTNSGAGSSTAVQVEDGGTKMVTLTDAELKQLLDI